MTTPGDPGHVTGHNTLEDTIRAEASRFGVSVTLTGPFSVGAPNHIGVHNLERQAILDIAAVAGVTVTVPDEATLGELGHTSDHDVMTAAVAVIATAPAWNTASGGTITTVGNIRRHTFTSPGTFTVNTADPARPFTVYLFGSGGGGGYKHPGFNSASGGGGGYHTAAIPLTPGGYPITIGAAGTGQVGAGSNGGDVTAFGFTAGGGGGGADQSWVQPGRAGNPGVPTPAADGGSGYGIGTGSNPTAGRDTIVGLDATTGDGGPGGSADNTPGGPGYTGAVVIEYQIAPAK